MRNNLQISTRVRRLFQHIEDFEKGNIQVPPFQRDFVWSRKQKLELLDSIKKGYPIGSILFWRPNSDLVKDLSGDEFQTIGSYKLPEKNADFFYILDGYQRLSTLFGCLVNPSKTNLKRNEEDWRKNFDIIYNLEKDEFQFNKKTSGLKIYEVPLFKFIDGEEFYEFQTQLFQLNIEQEKVDDYLSKYKSFGAKVSTYDIPSIDLVGGSIKEAVDIFSRLNSKGQIISNDWKISALSYDKQKGFRLGTEIDELLFELKKFNFFNKKGDKKNRRKIILQCITNSFGEAYFDAFSKNDQTALEKLAQREDFISVTRHTFKAIQEAVSFLFYDLKILSSRLIPYTNHLIFITDFFSKVEKPTKSQLETLKNWFWVTTYSNYFTRYNLSKQRIAYDRFQKFIENEDISPIYYDRENEKFETAEFPNKINMGSVRAKALALFMLNYQVSKFDEFVEVFEGYKTFKLFRDEDNSFENTIFAKPNDFARFKTLYGNLFDLIALSTETYDSYFITQEMKESYKGGVTEKGILKMRKDFIMKQEKEYVDNLGMNYQEIS